MNKIAIFLVLSTSALSAQVTLQGKIINMTGMRIPQIAIEYWNADHWQQSEGTALNDDNTFSINMLSPNPGQYRFRMFGQSKVWSDFIIPDSNMYEKVLSFELDYAKMNGSPTNAVNSKANQLYFDLMTAYQTHDSLSFDWGSFNRKCLDIVAQHRKSLIGDIALSLYEPQKSDFSRDAAVSKMTANEFVKAHALDKIPFEHDYILRHNALAKQLNRYCNYFDKGEKGGNALIDAIMARRNGNDAVDGFLFRFLLDKMMDSKNDPSLSYLLKWYAPDCPDDDPQPDYINNLIAALKACAPGKIAADLSYANPEGQAVNLAQVCAKNKLTILLFWKSSCSHCKEFEPVLEGIYQKYHPLGVEVYALSSDRDEATWRTFLQNKPNPWINVFIPQSERADIGKKFPAPSTPTIIVLDKNRKVVGREVSRANLEAYLDEELAKIKK